MVEKRTYLNIIFVGCHYSDNLPNFISYNNQVILLDKRNLQMNRVPSFLVFPETLSHKVASSYKFISYLANFDIQFSILIYTHVELWKFLQIYMCYLNRIHWISR